MSADQTRTSRHDPTENPWFYPSGTAARRSAEKGLDRKPGGEEVHRHHRASGVRDHRGEPAERSVAEA